MNFFSSNMVIEAYFSLPWPQESRNLFLLLSSDLLASNDKLILFICMFSPNMVFDKSFFKKNLKIKWAEIVFFHFHILINMINMWIPPCGSGFPNLPDQEEELTSTKKPQKTKKHKNHKKIIKYKNHKKITKHKNHKKIIKYKNHKKITKHKTKKKNNVKKTTLVSTCFQPMQMVWIGKVIV